MMREQKIGEVRMVNLFVWIASSHIRISQQAVELKYSAVSGSHSSSLPKIEPLSASPSEQRLRMVHHGRNYLTYRRKTHLIPALSFLHQHPKQRTSTFNVMMDY